MTLLSVRNLTVDFPLPGTLLRPGGTLRAVDDVSFDLAAGETLAIVGESGCGKSTLGRAVLRLLPAAAGRVVWLGEDLHALDAKAMRVRRRDLQIVFQDPLAALDPRLTIGESIGEPLLALRPDLNAAARRARVGELLRQVGLDPVMADRYPHEFSGGQCQRIGIARALAPEPRLIVCDEPLSALDVSIQAQIVNLLRHLQRDLDLSLLFITHNLAVVRRIAHRAMVLYLGRVAEIGPTGDLFAAPRHPYTAALLAAAPVPDPAIERGRTRQILQGDPPSPLNPPSGCVFRTRCPRADSVCAAERPVLTGGAHGFTCHHPL